MNETLAKIILLTDVLDSYLYELDVNREFKKEVNKLIKQGRKLRKFYEPVLNDEMKIILGKDSDKLKSIIDKF